MDTQTTEQVRRFYRQATERFVKYCLDFARQHRYDFEGVEEELENIHRAVALCLTEGNFSLSERVDALTDLAAIVEALGDLDAARSLYRQQIQICDQSESQNNDVLIAASRQLARLARRQEDHSEVQNCLERWLKIAQEQENAREQVDILLELAELHQEGNDLDQADLLCRQGLGIAQRIAYRLGIVLALRQQASIRLAQRRYLDARTLYRAALNDAIEMRDQVAAREIREHLAVLEAAMGRNIFVSYNHRDRDFAERLARDLKAAGFAVWWDEWEIKVGDSIVQKVSQGINQSAYLAVVLSPNSVKSNWVQRELGSALMGQLSAARNITILPLLVTDCEVPVLLREIKWADFRQDYQAGLQGLLDALIEDRG